MKGSRSGASMYMFKPRLAPLPPDRHRLTKADRPRVRKLVHQPGMTMARACAELKIGHTALAKYIRRMHLQPSWDMSTGKPSYGTLSLRERLDIHFSLHTEPEE